MLEKLIVHLMMRLGGEDRSVSSPCIKVQARAPSTSLRAFSCRQLDAFFHRDQVALPIFLPTTHRFLPTRHTRHPSEGGAGEPSLLPQRLAHQKFLPVDQPFPLFLFPQRAPTSSSPVAISSFLLFLRPPSPRTAAWHLCPNQSSMHQLSP